MRRVPLGNHEFATVLLLELESAIQSVDGTLHLLVGRRLRGNPLQP